MQSVLVVDDEEAIVDFLEMNLRREQLAVLRAHSGEDALALVQEKHPDLVLLDVGLPGMDGFEVCQTIRSFSQVPIIMVTARGDDEDKIRGLGLGSDDYVVKPFNPKELVARVKRMLERSRMLANAQAEAPSASSKPIGVPPGGAMLAWQDLEVDMVKRRVLVGDKALSLTPKEYDLLVYLVSNPEQVLGRDTLLREVWGSEAYDARSVDVHVKYLREKLGEPAARYVQTVWGKGYKLSATPKS